MLTTDKNDPELGHGIDSERIGQHSKYLVLSEEERNKGFVRPVRDSYIHVGRKERPGRVSLLTDKQKSEFNNEYVAFLTYDKIEGNSLIGIFMTQHDLDTYTGDRMGGCGTKTKMNKTIAETYARDPKFYGATYCIGCFKHLDVNEFVWEGTNETVGS
jgi:hypothetical protein